MPHGFLNELDILTSEQELKRLFYPSEEHAPQILLIIQMITTFAINIVIHNHKY